MSRQLHSRRMVMVVGPPGICAFISALFHSLHPKTSEIASSWKHLKFLYSIKYTVFSIYVGNAIS